MKQYRQGGPMKHRLDGIKVYGVTQTKPGNGAVTKLF